MQSDILYVVGQLSAGGQERQLCCLLRGLTARGLRPSLVVWNLSTSNDFLEAIQDLGISVDGFSKRDGRLRKLMQFRQTVARRKPRIVHSYSFYTNFVARFASTGNTLPLGSVRNEFIYSKQKEGAIQGRLSARWPAAVICNSRKAKEEIADFRGFFKPRQVFFVRNGLDLGQFVLSARNSPTPHVLGIGRLVKAKRWDLFVNAVARLRSRGLAFKASIVGDGPLRQSLLEEIQGLGLQGVIEILGYQEEIPRLLSEASTLALTSDYEGCPNVVMEAMAAGRAVVGTDVGDVRDLVDDGVTGFVTPPGDLVALSDRLGRLISDSTLCRSMGEAGRARAEREFGMDRLVDETLAVYRALGWTG